MIVYRLNRAKYARRLSGKGAAIHGGRWHKKGTEVIYTASSRALAMAEVLVHFSLQDLPDDYFMLVIFVPDDLPVFQIPETDLPRGWQRFPYMHETQDITDAYFHEDRYGLLRLPSAVVKGDYNYLINPMYRDFDKIRIVERVHFPFDTRLVF